MAMRPKEIKSSRGNVLMLELVVCPAGMGGERQF